MPHLENQCAMMLGRHTARGFAHDGVIRDLVLLNCCEGALVPRNAAKVGATDGLGQPRRGEMANVFGQSVQ